MFLMREHDFHMNLNKWLLILVCLLGSTVGGGGGRGSQEKRVTANFLCVCLVTLYL